MSYEGSVLSPARLPVATGSAFGAVKSGSNITNTGGTLSLTSTNVTTALTFTPENVANKNAANGYAGLSAGSLIAAAQLPLATGAAVGAVEIGSNITVSAGVISLTSGNVTSALTYTPVNKNGDTMTGLLVLSGDATNPLGAATLQQVQASQAGLGVKLAVKLATTAVLSPAATYANGTSGVGATLTGAGNGTLTVDGVLTALNDRILVKNEATPANNGIYKVTTAGAAGATYVLTRVTDFDNTVVDGVSNFQFGAYTLTEEGTANQGVPYVFVGGVGTATPGTTAINWTVYSIPNSGVTSLAVSGSGLNASASTGAVTISFSSQTQNLSLMSPNGSSGVPTFRAIVAADLPTATGAALGVAEAGAGLTATSGVFSVNTAGVLRTTRVVTAAGTVTCTTADDAVLINKTSGAATAVTLTTSPATGDELTIKDAKGDAGTNNITVSPAAGTIDGVASALIDSNYGSRSFLYNGTEWNVV